MNEDFLKKNRWILTSCALLLLFTMQRFTAMFAIIFALPVFIWFVYSIFVISTQPAKRKQQLVKVIIWLFTGLVILGVQSYRIKAARHTADAIVFALKNYKTKHGVYPASLNMIGQDSLGLKKELMLHYSLNDGTPILLYASTLNSFDKIYYDFEKNAWIFRPD